MGSIEQPDPTLDQILERLGLTGAQAGEQRRAVGELAYRGRLPLAYLKVLRRADFLPYDASRPEED
jgi:hypothetical protein